PKTSAATRPGLSLPLFVLFVFFAILSFTTSRLIPLFAVVAAPIAVLNLQDFVGRLWPASAPLTQRQHNLAFAGRGLALLAFLLLLVCAWPGWLHAHAEDWRLSHRVRWKILDDPGVTEAAEVISKVQQQTGLMKLGLCYDPEGGND